MAIQHVQATRPDLGRRHPPEITKAVDRFKASRDSEADVNKLDALVEVRVEDRRIVRRCN
jgi:hypothetical protein